MATVEERGLAGADDDIVLAQAVAENRALLTRDMDLSNILLYSPHNVDKPQPNKKKRRRRKDILAR